MTSPAISRPEDVPPRHQDDGLADVVSAATGISFPPDEDMTRQEFAQEADLNHLLKSFGVGPANYRPPVYGEADFDLDLQGAYSLVREAEEAFATLPRHLLDKFGGPQGAFLAFLNREIGPEDFKDPSAGSSSAATGDGSRQAGEAGAAG